MTRSKPAVACAACLLVSLLAPAPPAHACPDGMVTQQGQGVVACIPGPNYEPPSQFPDRSAAAPAVPPPPDPLTNQANFMMNFVRLQQLEMTRLQETLRMDPELKAIYERQKKGEWRHLKPSSKAKPGEGCIALFGKTGRSVAVIGPSAAYKGALLVFMGARLPTPAQPVQMPMTLEQTGEAPASVKVHNYRVGATSIGAVAFAIPSFEAALSGMLDTHRFGLVHDGRKILDIEWTGGLAARDKLRSCASAR
jgi:hypothetical protein